jgi:hypothetical protein
MQAVSALYWGDLASLRQRHSGKGLAMMNTAANGLILALDLGKYKSVACWYDRAGPAPRGFV